MKRISTILLVAIMAFSIQLILKAQGEKPTLNDLSWLSGCWDNGDSLRRYEEQWMKPAGTSILGVSRTVAKGRTVAYEFLRIQKQESGDIYYVAHPSGQAQDSFKLAKYDKGVLFFENPQHDFPQRIIYRLNGNSLIARIEGTSKGKQRSSDFPMLKTNCD